MRGPAFIVVKSGPFAVRKSSHDRGGFRGRSRCPRSDGGETNEKELKDLVAMGKELFTQVGCEACHRVEPNDAAVSSGPNVYGLIRNEPRNREVVEGEGHRFQIKAGREYLRRSVRAPGRPARRGRERRDQGRNPIYP